MGIDEITYCMNMSGGAGGFKDCTFVYRNKKKSGK